MSKRFLLLLLVAATFTVAAIPFTANAIPSQVNIQNKTGINLRISFTGPHIYYFQIDTGKNKVSMEPGIYRYSYIACGATITGRLKVKASGTNLVLPKCPKDKESKGKCDPSYPTVCIPKRPPDLDCWQITIRGFKVIGKDAHNFDGDHDGIGCELY